jgi:hypothetical protein
VLACLYIPTAIGLSKRKRSGWELNWLVLAIEWVLYPFSKIQSGTVRTGGTNLLMAFLFYGLIWVWPNYLYFKKRQSLFLGQSLFSEGFLRVLWPSLATEHSETRAIRQDVLAAGYQAIITGAAAIMAFLGAPVHQLGPESILDACLFAVVCWSIFKNSRIASVIGLCLFVTEQIYNFEAGKTTFGDIWSLIVIAVLCGMYLNAIRGTMRRHRREREAVSTTANDAHPTRWVVYCAVLGSFVMGVIALKSYEFFSTQVRHEATSEGLTEVIKAARKAVVRVISYDASGNILAQGSGFFVSKQGEILTNHHVLHKAASAEFKTSDGQTHKIDVVLADDPDSDLMKVLALLDNEVPFLALAQQRP